MLSLLLQGATGGNSYLMMLPYLLIFVIFYFLILRPMQKQKKDQQRMLSELKNGDVVLTSGGIIGTILTINTDDESLVIRVKPDNIKVQIARASVQSLVTEKK
ncbi:MAG: preprotein translocase subunit YajC [Bryobacterales bacterium]|nr:preprotein translocase subunit YajC [Bryobacterales bacterium]